MKQDNNFKSYVEEKDLVIDAWRNPDVPSVYDDVMKFSNCQNVLVKGVEVCGGQEDCIDVVRGTDYFFQDLTLYPLKNGVTIKGSVNGWHLKNIIFDRKGSEYTIEIGQYDNYWTLSTPPTRNGIVENVNLKGGGKSDPAAVAEIERNINDDPSFLAQYDIEKFDATYGLRLSLSDYEMYRNKLASARGKSMESANALGESSMNLMLNRSLLDHKLVIDLTGKVEDEDNEQNVAATKADIRHEWDRWSAEFSKRNSGKSPGREEFRDFLKSYWNDREVTGIDKRVSEFTDEDLSKYLLPTLTESAIGHILRVLQTLTNHFLTWLLREQTS